MSPFCEPIVTVAAVILSFFQMNTAVFCTQAGSVCTVFPPQRRCSCHGNPVHMCPGLLLAGGGGVGGQVEPLKASLSFTSSDQDRGTERRCSPHCSFHHPSIFSFLSSSSSSSIQNQNSLHLCFFFPSSPPLSVIAAPSLTDRQTGLTLGLLHLHHHHPPQRRKDRETPDPPSAGSLWQRSSALVSPKNISCMRSWGSEY